MLQQRQGGPLICYRVLQQKHSSRRQQWANGPLVEAADQRSSSRGCGPTVLWQRLWAKGPQAEAVGQRSSSRGCGPKVLQQRLWAKGPLAEAVGQRSSSKGPWPKTLQQRLWQKPDEEEEAGRLSSRGHPGRFPPPRPPPPRLSCLPGLVAAVDLGIAWGTIYIVVDHSE